MYQRSLWKHGDYTYFLYGVGLLISINVGRIRSTIAHIPDRNSMLDRLDALWNMPVQFQSRISAPVEAMLWY
ncbi:hypothetical protein BJY04DRAFT_191536, partial [Aspergillus karnatakaensis]|uniref:uncharacterized protein n=1 Tax=Aspergillus karnatakaensis TaxID=1810916 RepID=UPI003CCD455C